MFRVLGMFGLGGAFLLISPELRGSLMGTIDSAGKLMELHSPLSYVLLGVALLFAAIFWVHRSAQPR